MTREEWAARLPVELAFWNSWLGARGAIWGLDPTIFTDALDPNLPLQPHLRDLLGPTDARNPYWHILDVGSGPLTSVGKGLPWGRLRLTACDALAREYGDLCAAHQIEPLVPVLRCDAEELAHLYAPETFDLVHCTNALDHVYHPWQAIGAMCAVVKPGGAIYLKHHVRTADKEHRIGLHQWNFYGGPGLGDFVIEGPDMGAPFNVTSALAVRGYTSVTTRQWPDEIETIIRKHAC